MLRRALRKIIVGLAIGSSALTLAALNAPSSQAVTTCTLKGSLPSKVVLNKQDVIVYSTLSGSAGCKPRGGEFWGADASFDGPDGLADYAIWDTIGEKSRFDLWAWDGRAGTYTLRDGEGFVFDADYNDIPVVWQNSSTKIKWGSRIVSTSSTRSGRKVTVRATVQRYTSDASYKAYKTTVYLQRRSKTASSYSAYKTLTSSSTGKVSYSYYNRAQYYYRFVVKDATTVWGSTGAATYR